MMCLTYDEYVMYDMPASWYELNTDDIENDIKLGSVSLKVWRFARHFFLTKSIIWGSTFPVPEAGICAYVSLMPLESPFRP